MTNTFHIVDPSGVWISSKFLEVAYNLFRPKDYELAMEYRMNHVPIHVLGLLEPVDWESVPITAYIYWRKK